MSRKLAAVIFALSILVMTGCASMSSEECATGDWHAIGYEDGARGYTSDAFSDRRKACAKHGYSADFAAYQEGRDEGLVQYCQPSRGYSLGTSGYRYNGVCDAALEEEFLDAYRVGYQLYTLRSNVNAANSRIAAKESELVYIADATRDKEALLIAAETTTQERLLLLADLKELSERKGELEEEIQVLIQERARHEAELYEYESTVAAYGF